RRPSDRQGGRGEREPGLRERPGTARDPAADEPTADGEARENERGTRKQPVLELDARPNTLEPGVALPEHVHAVGARTESEREDLRAHDRQQGAADHRVDIPAATEDTDVREHADHDQDPEAGEEGARDQKEVCRAVDNQEAKMPPAVPEARKLRLHLARVVLDRDLRKGELLLA